MRDTFREFMTKVYYEKTGPGYQKCFIATQFFNSILPLTKFEAPWDNPYLSRDSRKTG